MWFLFPESTISFIHYHEKAISTLFSKVTLNEKSPHQQTYEKNSCTFYLRMSCHVFISIDITCDLLYSRSSKCHNISPKGDFLVGECYPRFCNRWIFSTLSKETRFSRKQKLTWLHEKSFVDYVPQWGKSQTVLCNRLLVLLRHNSKTFLIVWLSYLFRLCHWFRDKFITELAVLCSPMKVDINTISLAWATLLLVDNKFVDSFTIPANYLSCG